MGFPAKLFFGLFLVALCSYGAVCALLFVVQGSLLYYPTRPLPNDTTPKIALHRDGAELLISTRQNTGAQAILYFGGNGEDVTRSLPLLARAFPNAAIYALHYRSYSGSTGKPTEENLVEDGNALFDLVYRKHSLVTAIGRSLGSGIAIQVASQRPVARLVLVSPYNSILELAQQRFPFLPLNWLLRDRYESWRYASLISAPTTVIAAENDDVIPMSSTERLVTHFRAGVASFKTIRNTGHNDISSRPEYVHALRGDRARE